MDTDYIIQRLSRRKLGKTQRILHANFDGAVLEYGDPDVKRRFHTTAKSFMRGLAGTLGLTDFDVRSNMGGIAVSGEITLHADNLYVQISRSAMSGLTLLVRGCRGKQDYTGLHNHFIDLMAINTHAILLVCERAMEDSKKEAKCSA